MRLYFNDAIRISSTNNIKKLKMDFSYTLEEFNLLYDIFISIIDSDLKIKIEKYNQLTPIIESQLKELITRISLNQIQQINTTNNEIKQQMYIIYIILRLFNEFYKRSDLKIEYNIYMIQFVQQNILILCNKYFPLIKKFLQDEIVYALSYVRKNKEEYKSMKSDIMYFILFETLYLQDPITIKQFKLYYRGLIQDLSFYYIRHHFKHLIQKNISVNMLYAKKLSIKSDRINIYSKAFKIWKIQQITCKSNTLNIVQHNFKQFKEIIYGHELQVIFLNSLGIDCMEASANSILLMLNQNKIQLYKIQLKTPIVYNILKAVKIKQKKCCINKKYEILIKTNLNSILFNKFKSIIDGSLLTSVTDQISTQLTESITYSRYINPFTMEDIELDYKFVNELNVFLRDIL
jgi:hypothetical protein